MITVGKNMQHKIFHITERGQAIILIAAAAIGLIAMVGLIVDGGILLIEYGRLKRAIDAASLSAALQYREGYTITELENASEEFLNLNQSNVFNIQVDTDDTDASLVTSPRRKMVRVTASRHVRFGFLRVIGIYETDLTATSIGEAASVDLVIVLDSSQSMAAEGGNYPNHYAPGDYDDYGDPSRSDMPQDDPSQCNPTNTCHPFLEIKEAAKALVDKLYFPYDHVAIVTFDRDAHEALSLTGDGYGIDYDTMTSAQIKAAIRANIDALTVFQPPQACIYPLAPPQTDTETHCINNPLLPKEEPAVGTVDVFNYPMFVASAPNYNPSSIAAGNIGGGLGAAGDEFGNARDNSLWVVIVLAGSPATTGCTHTTGFFVTDCAGKNTTAQGRICPGTPGNPDWVEPLCRDNLASSRHASSSPSYDADDYARDNADWIAGPDTSAIIFSIGLGNLVITSPAGDPDAGEQLLTYAAMGAGGSDANHGAYYFSPDAFGLQAIFLEIANNIATRLSQ